MFTVFGRWAKDVGRGDERHAGGAGRARGEGERGHSGGIGPRSAPPPRPDLAAPTERSLADYIHIRIWTRSIINGPFR